MIQLQYHILMIFFLLMIILYYLYKTIFSLRSLYPSLLLLRSMLNHLSCLGQFEELLKTVDLSIDGLMA